MITIFKRIQGKTSLTGVVSRSGSLEDSSASRSTPTPATRVAVDAIISHMHHICGYVQSQRAMGRDTTSMVDGQVNAVIGKIQNLSNLDVHSASAIMGALVDMPFDNGQQNKVASAIDDRVLASTECAESRKQQYCDSFEHYLVTTDWQTMDGASLTLGCDVVGHRAYKWGICCPAERLLGRMAAIVAMACLRVADPDETLLNNLKQDIKRVIKRFDTRCKITVQHTKDYPMRPDGLHPDIVRRACGDELPIAAPGNIPSLLTMIMSKKFLRGSANALKHCGTRTLSLQHRANPNAHVANITYPNTQLQPHLQTAVQPFFTPPREPAPPTPSAALLQGLGSWKERGLAQADAAAGSGVAAGGSPLADLQSTLRTQREAIAEAKAMAKTKKKTPGKGKPTRAAKVRALAKVKAAEVASGKKRRVEVDDDDDIDGDELEEEEEEEEEEEDNENE